MEFEVKESRPLEDGKHNGKIVAVEYRDTPYEYTDVVIEEAKTKIKLKYGCPSIVSEKSRLGKLLLAFKLVLKVGEKIDPEKVLVGKEVVFMTLTEKTDKGEFSNIVAESVKPKE